MAEENTAIVTQPRNLNPFEYLLSLLQNFKLQWPLFNKQSKPDVVSFPERRKVPEPIRLHEEEPAAEKSSAVMWQVYAVGAYVVAKWAWSQWEKRARTNPSDNDDQ